VTFDTYIYLNEAEIDSLFAQHVGLAISEQWKTGKKGFKGGVSAKIMGIGGDIGGNAGFEATEKKETTSAYKLGQIRSALVSSKQLCSQLQEAVQSCPKIGMGVYIEAVGQFQAPQFKEDDAVEQVNHDGAVILECKIDRSLIVMSLGLNHMPRVRRGIMTKTGHDAIVLREIGDRAFPFKVFGYLHRISDDKFQIRPITVAL